jgi:hypothetical protein
MLRPGLFFSRPFFRPTPFVRQRTDGAGLER